MVVTFISVKTGFQATRKIKMEEAIVQLSKRFIYYDFFHKVPWIWGARKTLISKRKPSSLRPKYPGFCFMIALNFLYFGCILTILLRKVLGFEKEPAEVSIVGVFLIVLTGAFCMTMCSAGCMILTHSNLMGNILFQFRMTKGKNALHYIYFSLSN
jgi:hypothetical protein